MAEINLGIDGYPLDPTERNAFQQRELDSWLARGNPNSMPPALDWRNVEDARQWVLAMAQRHAWITAHSELLPPQAGDWRWQLEHLLTIGLSRFRYKASLPQEILLAVADIVPEAEMLQHSLDDYFAPIQEWTPELRAAAHRLLPLAAVTPYSLHSVAAQTAWKLFLDVADPTPPPDWSSAVRADVFAMPVAVRDRWLRLFKMAPKVPEGKWQTEAERAMTALGEGNFQERATAWLAPLSQSPFTLDFAGCLLLRLLLELTQFPLTPQLATARSESFWQLLKPRYGTRAVSGGLPQSCVDRFPLQDFPQQMALQAALDAELRIENNDPGAALKRLIKPGGNLVDALRTRLAWVEANTPDPNPPTNEWAEMYGYQVLLKSILSALMRSGIELGESEIVAALAQGSLAAFDRAAIYTKQHGYRPAIVAAVRQLQETLHGTIADQTARKHVGWWLWLDDVSPVDPAECWTGVIRADLRAMPEALSRRWLEVLSNMSFQIGGRIPAKWSKTARKALDALGHDEFHARIQKWFAALDSDKSHPLSTAGSDLLRCLLWDYTLVDRRPETDAAFHRLTTAKWKNKQARDRALKLTQALQGLFPEAQLPKRPVPKLPNIPNPSDPAGMLRFMLQFHPEADRVECSETAITVQGSLDEYGLSFDGRVTRRRSGLPVRIDLERIPHSRIWQGAIDQADLEHGPFSVNLQRIMLMLSVLLNDEEFHEAIR